MKIDPKELLNLAYKSGLDIKRAGITLQVNPPELVTDEWLETLKKHRFALLPFVEYLEPFEKGENLDPFCEFLPWPYSQKPPSPNTARRENQPQAPTRRETDRHAPTVPVFAKCPTCRLESA